MTYSFSVLSQEKIGEAGPVLEAYPHHLLKRVFRINADKQAEYDSERLSGALASPGGAAALVVQDNSPVGVVSVGGREWESKIFPFQMGHIPVIAVAEDCDEPDEAYDQMIRWAVSRAEEAQIRHLLCRAPAEDLPLIHALETRGFKHTATMVHVTWRHPDEIQWPMGMWGIQEAEPEHHASIENLAENTLTEDLTRFTADPHLPLTDTKQLYRNWARESLLGNFADVNLVAIDESCEVGGFISGRFNLQLERVVGQKVGDLTIGGVHPEKRKQKAFSALVQGILAWFWEQEAGHIVTSTQVTNYGSHRTLIQLDGRIVASHHCFHLWLGN